MTSPAELETSQQYMELPRRWFTEGWTGNLRLAHTVTATEHQHTAEPLPDELHKLANRITLAAAVQQWPLRMLPPVRDGDLNTRCLSTRHPARVADHPLPPASHANQPATRRLMPSSRPL
jgi:hypothetical protein